MITVGYDTYRIFDIPVNFAFNLPHVTSYVHHTGKKEYRKEILKKEKNSKLRERSLSIGGVGGGGGEGRYYLKSEGPKILASS